MSNTPAIRAEKLHKYYGKTHALAGLDLIAEEGSVLGLLGPNGAGKTTAVRILTTLLHPDAGHAEVAGLDVVKHADALRARIGLAGQYAAVDENLTGYENLVMFGRLVLPHSVVDNSDFSPTRLTAGETRLMLASEASSPFSPFQTARIFMALHVFVFLLVVCLLLSLARLGRLDWFPLRPSSSRGGAKRTTLHRLLKPRCPDDCPACRLVSTASSGVEPAPADVAPLARGQKPPGST